MNAIPTTEAREFVSAREEDTFNLGFQLGQELSGGEILLLNGALGAGKTILVKGIATALQMRMKADDFERLDLAYSPPFATTWDPLLIAAQQLAREF